MPEEQEDDYPFVVFDVADRLFCVNCSQIDGMTLLQEYTLVPNAPEEVRGIMKLRDSVITLLDLRVLLNMESLETQYREFCDMIDDRRRDHERWVEALENTAHDNVPFSLATDAHQCALGKWRDSFHCDVNEVNFKLDRLDTPHTSLHHSALEILDLWADGDTPANRKAIMSIYNKVKEVYMPMVLSLLEETKEVFHASVFREMVITLNSQENCGIVVEHIHSVEHLSDVHDENGIHYFLDQNYVRSIRRSEKIDGLIMELDPFALVELIADFKPPQI